MKERQHSTTATPLFRLFSVHCSCFTLLEVDLNFTPPERREEGASVVGVLLTGHTKASCKLVENKEYHSLDYVILLSDLVSTWFVSWCTLLSDYDELN